METKCLRAPANLFQHWDLQLLDPLSDSMYGLPGG